MFSSSDAERWKRNDQRKAASKKKPKKKRPEAKIQDEISKFLLKHGFLVIRINSGQTTADSGFLFRSYIISNNGRSSGVSDLIASKDGKVFFIEVKAPLGRQTQHQKDFQTLCINTENNYLIAKSIEDVEHIIKGV